MNKVNIKLIIASVVTAIVIAVSFSLLQYPQNEGFNPTDEGVVLAQSWRLINGEIPHEDFVSIRPAASGYLHAINFLMPGSLIANARWFVLFQFFAISLVISILSLKILSKKYANPKITIFISLLIAAFTITTLNYNLYSWTTIDAIFWSVLALPLFLIAKKPGWQILGLIFLSFAALSRQTFVLFAAAGFAHVLYSYKGRLIKSLPVILLGAIPFFAYLIMLIYHSAVGDFLSQMTGRTEFFETAILQFIKKFVLGFATPLNDICFILCAVLFFKRKTNLYEKFIGKSYHVIIAIIYVCFAIGDVFLYFFADVQDIHTLPFDLFFMLLFMSILHYVILPENKEIRLVSAGVMMISWLSAISLGDNTPVFASGILFVMLMAVSADIILFKPSKIATIAKNQIIIAAVSLLIAYSGFVSQQKFNYRDVESAKMINGLNEVGTAFGNIKTNPSLVSYYCELTQIYDTLPNALNNVVVFPHNAMFYPAMKTKNPLCLDWLIPNEYIGQEERIKESLNNLKNRERTYFIVDKIDLRIIKDGIFPRVYDNDLVYDFITENCEEVVCESEFFRVYAMND